MLGKDSKTRDECAKILSHRILTISKHYGTETESNYLCVSFEALCGLYGMCMNEIKDKISTEIYKLMKLIGMRIDKFGLISFLSGDPGWISQDIF